MGRSGPGLWDDPEYAITTILPKWQNIDLGSPTAPFRNIYGTFVGDISLPNNVFLTAENAAGNAALNLLKADASDNTVLNAPIGKIIAFDVNSVQKVGLSATALTGATGVTAAFPTFNLLDSADKNHSVSTTASGTGYSFTNTSAAITFGTSTPSLVLDKAGTYLILSKIQLDYVGATFAASRTATVKLRRTNNTPADVTGASAALATAIVTTVTSTFASLSLPPVLYTTTNTNDIIVFYGDLNTVPTAGLFQATAANLVAVRLY